MTNLLKNKFEFLWQKQLAPSEIDRMPYYEFEEWIKMMNERNKEEEEQQRKQNDAQQAEQGKYNSQMPNFNNFNYNPGSFNPGNFKL